MNFTSIDETAVGDKTYDSDSVYDSTGEGDAGYDESYDSGTSYDAAMANPSPETVPVVLTRHTASGAYTSHDSPEIVHRIESDLKIIIDTVRRGDPNLRSLILTGGFARGEGTVLGGVPQNDYDLVAVRGVGPVATSYDKMAQVLERRLGIHVDLAPVSAWRLRFVPRTVFWYETRARGRILWGENVLPKIRDFDAYEVAPGEGLRLLVNRSAGLLFATTTRERTAIRIQSAKALLAALDAHLLAARRFAPSQTERWAAFKELAAEGRMPAAMKRHVASFEWAFRFKTSPDTAPPRDAERAWLDARNAVLAAVPTALRHARAISLTSYGQSDGIIDRILYSLRAHRVTGARRLVLHPTGTVRVATLQLLAATHTRSVERQTATRILSSMARPGPDPLRTLGALRAATLQ